MKIEQTFKHNKQFTLSYYQIFTFVVKRLEIYEDNVQSEEEHRKECETSRKPNCNYFGGILQRSQYQLTQNLDNQQQQNKQLQKNNVDIRIYLEKLEKNCKKLEQQYCELIEEKEELSEFEINSDEDIYS